MGPRIARRPSLLASVVSVALAVPLAPSVPARTSIGAEPVAPGQPSVTARAGILVDASDGRVLWERKAHERRAVASTTKIVTALVVLEKTNPAELVTVSKEAESVGGNDPLVAEVELAAGERLTSEHLLYALLLESANDAAVALAEHVSGSVAAFVDLMNEEARRLRVADTQFRNPHGLDDPLHFSSAFDLSVFARRAMENELFRRIVATQRYEIPRTGRPATVVENRNPLLAAYPGANGIKTGQTLAAGKSLVASAERGDEVRIAVVLDSPDPAAAATALLDHGFTAFRRFHVADPRRPWGYLTFGDGRTLPLFVGREVSLLLPASAPAPAVVYRPEKNELAVTIGPGEILQVAMHPRAPPRVGADVKSNPVTFLWDLVAPLVRGVAVITNRAREPAL